MQRTICRMAGGTIALLATSATLATLATLSVASVGEPKLAASRNVVAGPLRFDERLILDGYGYAYGIAAADLDGDGDLDLTSSETVEDKLYWFENDGEGNLKRHFIYKDDPGWVPVVTRGRPSYSLR